MSGENKTYIPVAFPFLFFFFFRVLSYRAFIAVYSSRWSIINEIKVNYSSPGRPMRATRYRISRVQ